MTEKVKQDHSLLRFVCTVCGWMSSEVNNDGKKHWHVDKVDHEKLPLARKAVDLHFKGTHGGTDPWDGRRVELLWVDRTLQEVYRK